MNLLLITLDQFRGDCLSSAGHRSVMTPHLDRLAANGVRFARHYSQAAPCAPGRASLYTGMYQMNHRVVGNGTPLDRRFDNVARLARRAGYAPALFGYTDSAIDPRDANGRDDPRLSNYEGVLPGFNHVLDLTGDHREFRQWLTSLGYDDLPADVGGLLSSERRRPAEHSLSAFLTDRATQWISSRTDRWFAHLSYLRPHPPYSAAGHFSTMYDADALDEPIGAVADLPRYHRSVLDVDRVAAPTDPASMRYKMAQYYGMISEVDHQLGRLFEHLVDTGAWDNTIIIVTADHGEMLGDHGLLGKVGYWESSYHIPGIVRDPRRPDAHGRIVTRFTENVDVLPTISDLLGVPTPTQCDGHSLVPFLDGDEPGRWRTSAHWEFDWRDVVIAADPTTGFDRRNEHHNLAVLRTDSAALVHFGFGQWLAFDLAADPTWRTTLDDPAAVLECAVELLTWRSSHFDRTLTGMLTQDGGIGRWPDAHLDDTVGHDDAPILRLTPWTGPWDADDKDANFKNEMALFAPLDPLTTVRGLSNSIGVPVGSIVRYILARWATAGSGGLLEIGPSMINRLWEPLAAAETADDDEARLAAYHQVRQMVSWLKAPLDNPEYYGTE